jgi:hypothetical protein
MGKILSLQYYSSLILQYKYNRKELKLVHSLFEYSIMKQEDYVVDRDVKDNKMLFWGWKNT